MQTIEAHEAAAQADRHLEEIRHMLTGLEAIRKSRTHRHQEDVDETMIELANMVEDLHRSVASDLYFTRRGAR